jgi:nicotinamidase-related amidase/type 1 glutamine amidotransferase
LLEQHKLARVSLLRARGVEELPGLEALDTADGALFFTRRLEIDDEPLDRVKRYAQSGRPIVAVRTASHGFQKWLEMDAEVLGGNYQGHYGTNHSTQSRFAPGAEGHPILAGVEPFGSRASLYKTLPLASDCTTLLLGRAPAGEHPTAWTREYKGARIFTTSLGGQQDFECASFLRMLTNALGWVMRRELSLPRLDRQPPLRESKPGAMSLALRGRSGNPENEIRLPRELPLGETAAVLCDVWDLHWCRGANERCGVLAESIEKLVDVLRDSGVQIIHAPSETMGFYAGTGPRVRAQLAPAPLERPRRRTLPSLPPLPIDDSDGGCDTDDESYHAWTRQHPAIRVEGPDAVSDSGDEIERLMRQMGISHVLVMGVHTNMCVINRTFGIKSLVERGFQPVLVRDLTDAMYDPKDSPRVPHSRGTELVIEHIERHLCPSVTSGEIRQSIDRV